MNPKDRDEVDALGPIAENAGMTDHVDRAPRGTRASPVRQVRTVLVSACLLGEPVRYDGSAAPLEADALDRWREKARLVPFCPEIAAGMPVPRDPAEIRGGDGQDVLDGRARVLECTLDDVTETFVTGAQAALDAARGCGALMAILKEASPSCGSSVIYDGSFSSVVAPGIGVAAALLSRNGIRVFSDVTLAEAEEHLARLESDDRAPRPHAESPGSGSSWR